MFLVSKFLYNLSIRIYYIGIYFASFFNQKAKNWIVGRKQTVPIFKNKSIWFHCASLGEFEQARPLLEQIKREDPETPIVLSFFSPSGYEIRKNYAIADTVMYLPLDTAKNAKKFIEKINPKLVFFIKYEFWFHYLNTLKQKEIPTYLVSGIFRKNQLFFKSYGVFLKNMLQTFHHLFVQDIASANLLKSIGITQYSITNDTRFDQVLAIKNQAKKYDTISKFIGNKPCLILGSSWIKDELFFSKIITQLTNYQIIIAPHQIDKTRINAIQALFKSNVLYSELDEQNFATHCLIIDNIGMLSSLYFYATIVYIGGGFGVSIHNILEATIYEKPVLFGPAHQKMKEAKDLLQLGGAFEIKNEVEILETIHHLENTENYNHSSKICAEYMHNNLGATEKIIQFLKKEAKL